MEAAAARSTELRREAIGLPQVLFQSITHMRDVETDEALHKARVQAKRLRYAAEVVGDDKLVARAKEFQDVVGEHQDAVVAEEHLRTLAKPSTALVAGRLIERQAARRAEARQELPKAWKRLEKTTG